MQSVNGSMKQGDCVQLLKSFGFTDPVLVSHSDQTYTYKFNDYAPKQLLTSLGEPTIAGGGKVAVYQVPNVAKLGVSPTNSMVRLIDLTVKGGVSKGHIKIDKLPGPLGTAYLRASGDPTIRVAFIKKLWDHLNRAKFQARMAPPKLIVDEISEKGVRAFYQRGPNYTPGTIKVAPFLFNAREPFFVEIFLHEMCITGDSVVRTDLGDLAVSEFAASGAAFLQSRKGLTRVINHWVSGVKPTLVLTTFSGATLRLTDNHPVLVKKWYGYRWVRADRLRPTDRILRLES